jgi:hypothetical protein
VKERDGVAHRAGLRTWLMASTDFSMAQGLGERRLARWNVLMAKKTGVSGLSDRFLFALIDLEPEARPSGLDLSAVCFRLET